MLLKYLPGARRLYIDAVAAARDAKILDPWRVDGVLADAIDAANALLGVATV